MSGLIEIPLSKAVFLISPRVTALVNTLDQDGNVNSAPYSFVCPLSIRHHLVGVVIGGKRKHTYVNSKKTSEFVISIVSEDFAQQAVDCEEAHVLGENLLEKHGLHIQASRRVKVPRVREAKANLECKVNQFVELADDQLLMVGEVLYAEAEGSNGEIDLDSVKPLLHEAAGKFRGLGRSIVLKRAVQTGR